MNFLGKNSNKNFGLERNFNLKMHKTLSFLIRQMELYGLQIQVTMCSGIKFAIENMQ